MINTIQNKTIKSSLSREFNELTVKYLEKTNINYRKTKGQYFTPKTIREELIKHLPNNVKNPKVLDPACGTGEFLDTASKYFNNPLLYGWDIDDKLTNITKQTVPETKLKTIDSINYKTKEKFDFIIGNPPYFEYKPDLKIKNKYKDVISGRPNIFAFFIKLGIDLLKEGGYLAYVLPPSMNNGAYFEKLREYIIKNCNIEYLSILKDPNLFHNALQSTMILILKKGKNKGKYVFRKSNIVIFSEKPSFLKKSFLNKFSFNELGYSVKTGRLVWNQNRNLLTHDPKKGIPLIWARNITSTGLVLSLSNGRPQYVTVDKYDIGPAIVVNRIVGTVKGARLKAALIQEGFKFIAENHVNVIFPPKKNSQQSDLFSSNKIRRRISLKKIIDQIQSIKNLEVIHSITGNTQVSKTELEYLFPIEV